MSTSLPRSEAVVVEGLSSIVEELVQHENDESRAIGKALKKLGQSIGLLEDKNCKVLKDEEEEGSVFSLLKICVNNNMAASESDDTEVPGHNTSDNGQSLGCFSWIYGDTYEADNTFPCSPQLLGSPWSAMVLRSALSYPPEHKRTLSAAPATGRPHMFRSTTISSFGSPKSICDVYGSSANSGPIVDVVIGERNEQVSTGYSRVSSMTVDQFITGINSSTGSQQRYLYIKRDPTWTVTPVVSLVVVCVSKGENIPPSYCVVKSNSKPCDLSRGTKEKKYLCMKRCMGNPIMDVLLYPPQKRENLRSDFIPLSRTLDGLDADLNLGLNGASVQLAYRQRLLNVQRLLTSDSLLKAALRLESQTLANTYELFESENSLSLSDMDYSDSIYQPPLDSAHYTQMVSGCDSLVGSTVRDAFALIVTGLYFCHTHSTFACLGCLFKFMKNGFFDCNFVLHEDSLSSQGFQITLLECAVEAVTDQIDHADFNLLQSISSFLYVVLEHSGGRLPPFCIHRILCSLTIIAMRRGGKQQQHGTDDSYSLDVMAMDHHEATAFAVNSLKMYFSCLEKLDGECIRLENDKSSIKQQHHELFDAATMRDEDLAANDMVHALVIELVGEVVENVGLSHLMARTQEFVKRQSDYSSRAFWINLITLAKSFPQFEGGVASSYVFASLCILCKMASGEIHSSSSTAEAELVLSRDVAVKLCGIRLLNQVLLQVDCFSNITSVLGYEIRRLIPPIVLESASSGISNIELFVALLNLVGTLFLRYREHCKLELAVLIEKIILKTLLGPSQHSIRLLILGELQLWMREPNILVELFVNYDMDRMWTVQRRKVFESIISSVCVLAEAVPPPLLQPKNRKGMSVSTAWFASTLSHSSDAIELHEEALQCAVCIMKHLMEASQSTFQFVEMVLPDMAGGKENISDDLGLPSSITDKQIEQDIFGYSPMMPPPPPNNSDLYKNEARRPRIAQERQNSKRSETASGGEEEEYDDEMKLFLEEDGGAVAHKTGRPTFSNQPTSFYTIKGVRLQAEKIVEHALCLYQTKGLKNCVVFLIANDYIADSPRDIATFLHVYHEELSPTCIGEFMSEPDTHGKDKWRQICVHYVKAISFHDMPLEKALRCFLTNCGFRLPGEAQKIARILQVFVECYIEDNTTTNHKPHFKNSETVFLICYAVIMLNTDLHRVNTGSFGHRQRKGMTRAQFLANLRHIEEADEEYLSNLYLSVLKNPIQMPVDASEVPRTNPNLQRNDLPNLCRDLDKVGKQGVELFRALSAFPHSYTVLGGDTKLSNEEVKSTFEYIWPHFHRLVTMLLGVWKDKNASFVAVEACLDIIFFAISSALHMQADRERRAFVTQFLEAIHVAAKGREEVRPDKEEWYILIAMSSICCLENRDAAVASLYERVKRVKESVRSCVCNQELLSVSKRLRNINILEGNPHRIWVREGDLVKVCRSGRKVIYRFFLFSDLLLYGSHLPFASETWKVRGKFDLSTLSIQNLTPQMALAASVDVERGFLVSHPRKSFIVAASTLSEKMRWVRSIQHTAVSAAA